MIVGDSLRKHSQGDIRELQLPAILLFGAGSLNRKQWWLRLILPILVIILVLAFVDRVIGIYDPNTGVGILSGLFVLASLIPAILVDIKRWHDRDKSGWWMLIALIAIIGSIWFLIELGFLAGTPGPNRFGPPPTDA
jgi:uncharacterized membrane protein YhaH (DUF805 family)